MLFLSVANPADCQLGALDQSLHNVRVHEPLHDDSLQRILPAISRLLTCTGLLNFSDDF